MRRLLIVLLAACGEDSGTDAARLVELPPPPLGVERMFFDADNAPVMSSSTATYRFDGAAWQELYPHQWVGFDRHGNTIILDTSDHSVTRYAPGATTGELLNPDGTMLSTIPVETDDGTLYAYAPVTLFIGEAQLLFRRPGTTTWSETGAVHIAGTLFVDGLHVYGTTLSGGFFRVRETQASAFDDGTDLWAHVIGVEAGTVYATDAHSAYAADAQTGEWRVLADGEAADMEIQSSGRAPDGDIYMMQSPPDDIEAPGRIAKVQDGRWTVISNDDRISQFATLAIDRQGQAYLHVRNQVHRVVED